MSDLGFLVGRIKHTSVLTKLKADSKSILPTPITSQPSSTTAPIVCLCLNLYFGVIYVSALMSPIADIFTVLFMFCHVGITTKTSHAQNANSVYARYEAPSVTWVNQSDELHEILISFFQKGGKHTKTIQNTNTHKKNKKTTTKGSVVSFMVFIYLKCPLPPLPNKNNNNKDIDMICPSIWLPMHFIKCI